MQPGGDSALVLADAMGRKKPPKIGNTLFAAFLKNSLLDWSPPSFSFFFITLDVFLLPPELPTFGVNNVVKVWK